MEKSRSQEEIKHKSFCKKQDVTLQQEANAPALSMTPAPLTSEMRYDDSQHTSAIAGSAPMASSTAKATSHAKTDSNPLSNIGNIKQAFDFTVDIIDKQYRSYVWNDGKVQALVTIDAALIAGILLILQIFNQVSLLSLILLAVSSVFLLCSLLICLEHAIPRMNSGIGNEDNLRTMIGIARIGKEEYHKKITSLNLDDMVRMNCYQIAGMCKNNLKSHSLIKIAVRLTMIGVLVIGIALAIIVFSDWNRRNVPPAPSQPNSGHRNTATPPHLSGSMSADQAPVVPPSVTTSKRQSKNQQKPVAAPK